MIEANSFSCVIHGSSRVQLFCCPLAVVPDPSLVLLALRRNLIISSGQGDSRKGSPQHLQKIVLG